MVCLFACDSFAWVLLMPRILPHISCILDNCRLHSKPRDRDTKAALRLDHEGIPLIARSYQLHLEEQEL